jgi:lipopolysaccharide/colanic/teichoic acid biosynthesis glycosyltransferase
VNRIVAKAELVAGAAAVAVPAPRPAARQKRRGDLRQLRLRLYALLFACDGLILAAAFVAADLIRFGAMQGYGLTTFGLIFPVYVAVGLNGEAWSIEALGSPRKSAAAAARALIAAIAVATIILFSMKIGEDFSRLVFGIGAVLALPLVAIARVVLGNRIGKSHGWRFRNEVLLLDGLAAEPTPGERVVDAARDGLRPVRDDPAMLDRLARFLDGSERVVVACPAERRQDWSRVLAAANVDVEILTPELQSMGALGLRCHGELPTLLVGHGPLPLRARATKRLFDVAVASTALILLAPVLGLIALAIRLESPGPAMFRQERLGRGNRLFEMLKFRSMRCDEADLDGSLSASRGDERVTRVGRLLRATSLDELPQLINVIKGDMSIVGPRPHPLGCRAEDELFWAIDERYFDRHAMRPGMTGLAQVRGYRGATARRQDLTDRLQADLEYLEGWHIGRDVAIVARTLLVLVHPNAF